MQKFLSQNFIFFLFYFKTTQKKKILLDIMIFATPHNCHKCRKVEKNGMNIEIVALNETSTYTARKNRENRKD